MPTLFKDTQRFLIPNWRNFKNTAQLGELNSSKKNEGKLSDFSSLTNQINDWKENKTIGHAADLISAALSLNITNHSDINDAVQFLKSNIEHLPKTLKSVIFNISGNSKPQGNALEFEDIDQLYSFFIELTPIYERIHFYKLKIKENPKNAINYIEVARYYSLIGEFDIAQKQINIALYLARNNRFVIRSAIRFFIHRNELDTAHSILKRSESIKIDPWLLAPEISLSSMRNKTSRFVKNSNLLIESQKFSPFNISELASSLASIELLNGNSKISKKLFSKALVAPNDNALAQIEWMSNFHRLSLKNSDFNTLNSFEAETIDMIFRGNWDNASIESQKWLIDQPFSSRPAITASYIAIAVNEDYELGKKICEIGLSSNSDDSYILNNYTYACLMSNNLDEAAKTWKKIESIGDKNLNIESKIHSIATTGLFMFKAGNIETGRELYNKAIKIAQENSQTLHLAFIAATNLVREEILAKTDYIDISMKIMNEEYKKINKIEFQIFKDRIDSLYLDYIKKNK